jgi:hypothetical protein
MENLQNSVSIINTEKVFSLEKAREIILADRMAQGMEPVVYCLRATDATIYPTVFGFVFIYEKKILLFQDVVDWKRDSVQLLCSRKATTLLTPCQKEFRLFRSI